MKTSYNILVIIGVLVLFSNKIYSQDPVISYIIPDIVAPGMNSYIEIIAPYNNNYAFGVDGFYLNNSGDSLRVVPLNLSDTNKIVFGPLIVTWNGRLISTQVFAKPHLNPNSSYWAELNQEFRIPVRVIVQRQSRLFSNVDTIYIVRPSPIGNQWGNSNTVFGDDNLSRRSRRGALIADSVILSSRPYTVSVMDCDPYIPGNQGYLPFILLSKGRISGVTQLSGINVNGGVGQPQHAGPGGGGGGGNFCDGSLINPLIGSNGGDGFTGGGPGGRNAAAGGTNAFTNYGSGTGQDGSSLNGVPPPPLGWYESSGGGTGHPFGQSGFGCVNGESCDPSGGYGGGSGFRQNSRGGSGGYITPGLPSNGSLINGGQIHGNPQGIPIAGGSGGASGNPQSIHSCSGSGGGGGGAIRVFSFLEVNRLKLNANGANGVSSSNGSGGAGSGGYISIQSKLSVSQDTLSALGGSGGGNGIVLFDSPTFSFMSFQPPISNFTRGITTDTTTYVRKKFRITGSKNLYAKSIQIYIKPERSNWYLDTNYTGLQNITNWSKDITLSGDDSLYFLVAVQDFDTSYSSQYFTIHRFTTSQASANILNLMKYPEITGDTLRKLKILSCPESEVLDNAIIRNVGTAPLILEMGSAAFKKGNVGFSLVTPRSQVSIYPKDSIKITVKFVYKKGQWGIIRDTLEFQHNDGVSPSRPWRIAYEVQIDSLNFETYNFDFSKAIDTVDFGLICIGSDQTDILNIKNLSIIPLDFNNPELQDNNNFSYEFSDFQNVPPRQSAVLSLKFAPVREGNIVSKLFIKSKQCPTLIDTIVLKGYGINTDISAEKPLSNQIDTLNFGKVCVNQFKVVDFILRNKSNTEISFQNFLITRSPEHFSTEFISRRNLRINDTTHTGIRFSPKRTGFIQGTLVYNTIDCPDRYDTLILVGQGVVSNLTFKPGGTFGSVKVGNKEIIEIVLVNEDEGDVYIESLPALSPPFRFIDATPQPPVMLQKNQEMRIRLEFEPQAEGLYTFNYKVFSVNKNFACEDTAEIRLSGVGTTSQVQVSSDSVYFGRLLWCQNVQDSIFIKNGGSAPFKLKKPARIEGRDKDNFTIASEPLGLDVLPGESKYYYIRFWGQPGPDGMKEAVLIVETDDPLKPEIRIKLTGFIEKLNITFNPRQLTFYTTLINESIKETIRLTNNGTFRRHINAVKSTDNNFSVQPQVADLDPGATAEFEVTFSPTTVGDFETSILFQFDTPCADTISIYAKGSGSDGVFIFTPKINFGIISNCDEVVDSIRINGVGIYDTFVDTMYITGADAALFRFINDVVFPYQLIGRYPLYRYIAFNPYKASEGIKTAQVISKVTTKTISKNLITDLTGEVKSPLSINPQTVSFGTVIVNSSESKSITITNVSNKAIIIKEILPLSLPLIFNFNPDLKNYQLNPGNSVSINIEFIPTAEIDYIDFLKIIIELPKCDDTMTVRLDGRGAPPISAAIILPEMIVEPTLRNFKLPVKAFVTQPLNQPLNVDIRATFAYKKNLLYVSSITKGRIEKTETIGDLNYISFSVETVGLNSDTTIVTEFICDALLGDVEFTDLNWEQISFEPTNVIGSLDTINGRLTNIICKEGGNRLVKNVQPVDIRIKPNPSDGIFDLEISYIERGDYFIYLSDDKGKQVLIESFSSNETKVNGVFPDYKLILDMTNFSSGVYFIILKTPEMVKVKKLFLIK